ncbi:hypothetical protein B0H13DRAFT_2049556 [Mycena leptocephala]|nr:hypothetical protein B0H13DRAFT_2049556 [Mycena leptocephala]
MTIDNNKTSPPPYYESQNMGGTTDSTPPERYIYYRVYTSDGAIPSKTAFDASKPFIGRITARSVPPPHIVTSLKRCFVKAENFTDPTGLRTVLYLNSVAKTPMDNTAKHTTLVVTPETALALVVVEDLTAQEAAAVKAIKISKSQEDARYLYYKLGSPIYAYAELYEDISAEKAMKDGSIYPSIQDGSAGCTETQPMVLGLLNRPFKVIGQTKNTDYYLMRRFLGYTDGCEKVTAIHRIVYECKMEARPRHGYIEFLDQ